MPHINGNGHLTEQQIDQFFEIEPRSRKRKNKSNKRLSLQQVIPKTKSQKLAFLNFPDYNLFLDGEAGTGKTFIALYLALSEILLNPTYDELMIFRSSVATRNIGFLPGNRREKMKVYEEPYIRICEELFEDPSAYNLLKGKKLLDFDSTSFLRGKTFNNTIIILDEMQNLTLHEMSSIITRIGVNCKIIICGDEEQTDLDERERPERNLVKKIIGTMKSFKVVNFCIDDVVRSGIVKEFLIAKKQILENRKTFKNSN